MGCKVNQYETAAIETILNAHDHVQGEPADVIIVNTCAVTSEAGRKSRQLINRLKGENPGALVAVCGCYSQLSGDTVDADIVFGTNDKIRFVEDIEKAVKEKCVDDPFKRRDYECLPSGAVDGRTRALLKIQDGCVNFCTYCIIPYTRGRLRSLSIEKIKEETEKLSSQGFNELVLTGIEIASYGVDLPEKPTLADAVVACAEASGNMRIRLGSLEPTVVNEEFCKKLASCGKVCRHFHLSLQSGCDRTLKAMNRKYTTAQFYDAVILLRKYFQNCAITCDLITGFPGETEEDFEQTLAFIEKCSFSDMHIFPYSRRPGTVADKMKDQNTKAVKTERSKRAQLVRDKMHNEYISNYLGKTVRVLLENNSQGHTDTYVLVKVDGDTLRNEFADVRIDRMEGDNLHGTCI